MVIHNLLTSWWDITTPFSTNKVILLVLCCCWSMSMFRRSFYLDWVWSSSISIRFCVIKSSRMLGRRNWWMLFKVFSEVSECNDDYWQIICRFAKHRGSYDLFSTFTTNFIQTLTFWMKLMNVIRLQWFPYLINNILGWESVKYAIASN